MSIKRTAYTKYSYVDPMQPNELVMKIMCEQGDVDEDGDYHRIQKYFESYIRVSQIESDPETVYNLKRLMLIPFTDGSLVPSSPNPFIRGGTPMHIRVNGSNWPGVIFWDYQNDKDLLEFKGKNQLSSLIMIALRSALISGSGSEVIDIVDGIIEPVRADNNRYYVATPYTRNEIEGAFRLAIRLLPDAIMNELKHHTWDSELKEWSPEEDAPAEETGLDEEDEKAITFLFEDK